MNNLPKKPQAGDATSDVLSETLNAVIEGVSGIASSERKELMLSAGHVFQRIRGGYFISQLKEEWEKYRAKGRIKDDYLDSQQHQESIQELLDFLDGDSPDQFRFEVMKRIFLAAASEKNSDRNSYLPQQYMRIIRSLSSGEVLLLIAAYNRPDTIKNAREWLILMANETSLRFTELVELHEEGLINKKLLTRRQHSDGSGIIEGHRGRLTTLGYNLCKYIDAGQIKTNKHDSA